MDFSAHVGLFLILSLWIGLRLPNIPRSCVESYLNLWPISTTKSLRFGGIQPMGPNMKPPIGLCHISMLFGPQFTHLTHLHQSTCLIFRQFFPAFSVLFSGPFTAYFYHVIKRATSKYVTYYLDPYLTKPQ